MERGSDKHSPMVDDQLKHELEGLLSYGHDILRLLDSGFTGFNRFSDWFSAQPSSAAGCAPDHDAEA